MIAAGPDHTRVLDAHESRTSLLLLRRPVQSFCVTIARNDGKPYDACPIARNADKDVALMQATRQCAGARWMRRKLRSVLRFLPSQTAMLPSQTRCARVARTVSRSCSRCGRRCAVGRPIRAGADSSSTRPRARRVMGPTGAASPSRFAASTSILRISPTAA